MKSITVILLLFFSATTLFAQQPFSVPEVTNDQEKEILYNHMIAYAATGITFAKTKGVSPEEYGKYIAEQFKPFWNPDQGFPMFANTIMFILKGMHPANEMQILEQNESMVRFKMKNVDAMFQMGPAYGITYKEFLECSKGILETLADYMNSGFMQEMSKDGWYVATINKK